MNIDEAFNKALKEAKAHNGNNEVVKFVVKKFPDGHCTLNIGSPSKPMPFLTPSEAMKDAIPPSRERPEPPEEVKAARQASEDARKIAEAAQSEWIDAITEEKRFQQKVGESAYRAAVNFDPSNPHAEISSRDVQKLRELHSKIAKLFEIKESAWEEVAARQRECNALERAWRLELLHQKLIAERNEAERKRQAKLEEQGRRRASLIERLKNRFLEEAQSRE